MLIVGDGCGQPDVLLSIASISSETIPTIGFNPTASSARARIVLRPSQPEKPFATGHTYERLCFRAPLGTKSRSMMDTIVFSVCLFEITNSRHPVVRR